MNKQKVVYYLHFAVPNQGGVNQLLLAYKCTDKRIFSYEKQIFIKILPVNFAMTRIYQEGCCSISFN